jgi:hypothetical protein
MDLINKALRIGRLQYGRVHSSPRRCRERTLQAKPVTKHQHVENILVPWLQAATPALFTEPGTLGNV